MSGENCCGPSCGYCGRCDDGPAPNATCADCFELYVKGDGDSDEWCDGCREKRDRWATEYELRMAKRRLPAAVKKEVA